MNMGRNLRTHIGEVYDGSYWESITGMIWQDGTPWQFFKFEHDVDFEGCTYRCVIINRCWYCPEDVEAVDYDEDIFAEAWQI